MQLILPQTSDRIYINESGAIDQLLRKGWVEVIFEQISGFDSLTQKLELINSEYTSSGFVEYYSGVYNVDVATNYSGILAQQAKQDFMNAGYNTNLGFNLAIYPNDTTLLTQMFTLVNASLQAGLITSGTPQTFADVKGVIQTLPTSDFCEMILGYGSYCKSLWDMQNATPVLVSGDNIP